MADPVDLPPGLVGDVARWMDSCASREAPALSLGAALAVVATACGRRYALPDGLRPVLFLLGVARSGVGKESARQCAIQLLKKAGLGERVGTDDIASAAGIVATLRKHPVRLFLLDEWGRMLQGYSSRNAANHERQIVTTYMRLWSSAPGTFLGRAYAEKEPPRIEQPHTVIWATTTMNSYAAAITGDDVADGVLSRTLMIEVDHGPQPRRVPTGKIGDPPTELVERIKRLADGPGAGGNLRHLESADLRTDPIELEVEAAALRRCANIDAAVIKRTAMAELWVRALEQTLRVAVVVALGRGDLIVKDRDVEWAWRFVRDSTMRSEVLVHEQMATTDEGRCAVKMIAAVRAAGEAGTTHKALTLATRHFARRVRDDALRTLVDSGRLVGEDRTSGKTGRASKWYSEPHDESDDTDEQASEAGSV